VEYTFKKLYKGRPKRKGKGSGPYLKGIRDILDRLRKAGLTVNANKCSITTDNIKILGHVVKGKGIFPIATRKLKSSKHGHSQRQRSTSDPS